MYNVKLTDSFYENLRLIGEVLNCTKDTNPIKKIRIIGYSNFTPEEEIVTFPKQAGSLLALRYFQVPERIINSDPEFHRYEINGSEKNEIEILFGEYWYDMPNTGKHPLIDFLRKEFDSFELTFEED